MADISAIYEQWSANGAEFLTPPIDRGSEIRCYMRDPDGHLIEVGELRARGVRIEEYDHPGLKTDQDGVADVGFAWAAWITDPAKNSLSILQLK